jgi:glycosyltransferase involved in cell wall biosynthesis
MALPKRDPDSPRRICLDLTPFEMYDRHGGIARYGAHLLRELVELPEVARSGAELLAMTWAHRPPVPAEQALRWVEDPGPECSLRAHRFRRSWRMGGQLERAGVDLFHAIDSNALPRRRPFVHVVTCHDLIPIAFPSEGRSQRQIEKTRREQRARYRRADHIIADSEVTRADLIRELGVPGEKIDVVHLGVDVAAFARRPDEPVSPRVLPAPYLISVGSDYYRKNQRRLAEAWLSVADQIPEGLVLVGRALYEDTFAQIEREVAARGHADRFAWLDDVRDAELPALYRGATAFVSPSLYEGFGLTNLEAMACDVPVVACGSETYREVADDAALYFDGTSVPDIAEKLVRISRDADLRADLIARGRRRVGPMSWYAMARATWQVYERLLQTEPAPR